MEKTISVIVPVYKVEKYLSRCIESIINQTYSNLEIILVDDGSPDKCGDICDHYASLDSRVKVIHKENGGLSDARNTGLNIATGEYVNFIDSDDYIHEKFYEKLLTLVLSNNADIGQCEFLKVFEDKDHNNKVTSTIPLNSEKVATFNNVEALNQLYSNVISGVAWNKLYKAELFKDIRFPKGKIHEDDFTTFKVLYNSKKIVTTSLPLYYYLQRSNSIMGSEFNARHLDSLEAFSYQISFYNNKNLLELKNKAIICLENNIRSLFRKSLNSDLENKDEILSNLINYYRNNFKYFNSDLNISSKKKVIIYLYKYSPIFIIKFLCRLLDLKVVMSRFQKINNNQ
jgi:glycosyltransferase involved in cell wall biosynthesis